ncbi:hypothetical protein IIB34_08395, partial [PVC group bacterium]|nr:hypothetical protein [PVC group bacterium]
ATSALYSPVLFIALKKYSARLILHIKIPKNPLKIPAKNDVKFFNNDLADSELKTIIKKQIRNTGKKAKDKNNHAIPSNPLIYNKIQFPLLTPVTTHMIIINDKTG